MDKERLLDKIDSPSDLKKLDSGELPALCGEIREFLVDHVTRSGGHLASNLGVVELTVALHRIFDSPTDTIVWDVGHQSYVHKMLTGRAGDFDELRAPGGLSGFTKRSESEHDAFGAGHSSTSVSAALGIARAKALAGDPSYTVAVLGDGAFTGGMVHEALNNSDRALRLIIVLNENEMSISKNIGRFASHIQKVRISGKYHKIKRDTRSVLYKIPLIGKPTFRAVRRIKQSIKGALYHTNYFEDLGLYYIGPVDGHNLASLELMLTEAKRADQSVIVHVKTTKGKGYAPAESEPGKYHGISPMGKVSPRNFSAEMGDTLCSIAEKDDSIVAITAAMADGCGLCEFARRFPNRFFDVGIAEEHALVFAAGLAVGGMRPFFAVYSTFLQRGYDNIIHDIALQHLPVVVCIDRANLAERDGPTHHGIFDAAFLSEIPDILLYAPYDFASLRGCLERAATASEPTFIRYPSSGEIGGLRERFAYGIDGLYRTDFAHGEPIDGLIVVYGRIVSEAIAAADDLAKDGKKIGILLLEQLKPLDAAANFASERLRNVDIPLLFLEEGIYAGSVSMLLRERLIDCGIGSAAGRCRILAIKDSFAPSKKGMGAFESCGISASDCISFFRDEFGSKADRST